MISGPSFLGLNDPAPGKAARKRASLSIDPHSAPDSNLDYLLEDEEQPRHWSLGKVFFILLALALVVGLGYLRWKNHGFAFLNPTAEKPSAVVQDSGAADTKTPAPAATGAPASQPPTQPASSVPQPAGDSTPSGGSTPPGNATATPAASAATPSTAPAPADAGKSDDTSASPAKPEKAAPPASDKTPETGAKQPASDASEPAPKVAEKPKAAPREPAPKPSPARPALDPVVEAQRYLYGKGVTQDCERGVRLLKPAANQGNPKAMIEMGALYSAGLCTPHDLPTAYRWFALALRKDPDNMAVQTDLQKLWGEMTQPERQLAIKLSQ
ncbi:MAG TPA: hypothetical protein VE377_00660 [Candidatus Dormibacteraeota bacterium]|nr:hypothetical protein [Candidatus Dormibacteraeota bacterium]